jgi:hypothetical protein
MLVKLGVWMLLDWMLNGFGNSGCFFPGLRRGGYYFLWHQPYDKNQYSIKMNPDDLQKLMILAMPFGKYKGRVVADLSEIKKPPRFDTREALIGNYSIDSTNQYGHKDQRRCC